MLSGRVPAGVAERVVRRDTVAEGLLGSVHLVPINPGEFNTWTPPVIADGRM